MITSLPKATGRLNQRAFTLIEMIVVIVLVAIVSVAVAMFIRLPISGYVDSVARADITDTGDTALRRIARDARLALPNSLRTTTGAGDQYLEMLLTRTGGRYLDASDNPIGTTGTILSFTNTAATTFDIVGPALGGSQTIQLGDSVVVYNLGTGIAPSDAYASPATNRAVVSSLTYNASTNVTTIGMASNPFASQSPSAPSPYHRFQIISGPVTYRCSSSSQTLTRYWGYTISESQPASPTALSSGSSALIASGVTQCQFQYQTTAAQTNALLEVNISLGAQSTDTGKGGTVGLFQQVHVDNTP
jgi:MSHA biogenesis protein MshO